MIGTESSLYNSLIEMGRPTKRRKILLLGAPLSGKTVLATRFKENVFIEGYTPTIQENIKKFYEFRNEYVELVITDLEGQTKFSVMTNNKFAFGINGYMLVYSVNNKESFELIQSINEKLDALVGHKFPRVLIGTKNDLEREVPLSEAKKFADEINCPFIETSSRMNDNVEKAFQALLVEINKNDSNFDLSKYCCSNILRCFVKNSSLTKLVFYLLLFVQIILDIASIIIGIMLITCSINEEMLKVFFPLFYGIWVIIFSLFCLTGLFYEKHENLKIYIYGIVFSLVVLISGIVMFFIWKASSPTQQGSDKYQEMLRYQKTFFFYLSPSLVIFDGVIMFFSYVFKKVYELDLPSYIL